MIDKTLQTAIGLVVEKTINTALRYDPASQLAIAKLNGQVLAVELSKPSFIFYFLPSTDGISIQNYFEGDVTTKIKGSALALASIANGNNMNLADSGVEVFGNTGLLIELQGIMQNLDIDWEDALSDVLGDVSAHHLADSLRGLASWIDGSKNSIRRLTSEYLSEELKATPSRPELNKFYQNVDALRIDTDRVAARVSQLLTKLNLNDRIKN
ncbi:ubiquinone biosynthesis accessory factor UbiJ [Aurantivibrio infirmus]